MLLTDPLVEERRVVISSKIGERGDETGMFTSDSGDWECPDMFAGKCHIGIFLL